MIKYGYIILFSVLTLSAMGQEDTTTNQYKLLHRIPVESYYMDTDILQNLYVFNTKGEIIKFDQFGKERFRYNEFPLGMPVFADVTNPFQVLIYFPEFQTVVNLENTLNKAGSFDLFDLDLIVIEALCFSNDGNVWLYDPTTFQLKKIDRNANTLLSSNELNFQFDNPIQPIYMLERGNQIFINDPNNGILIFDVYGQFDRTLDLTGFTEFQVFDNRLIFFKDKELFALHLTTFDLVSVDLPEEALAAKQIRISKNRLYAMLEEEILVYSF